MSPWPACAARSLPLVWLSELFHGARPTEQESLTIAILQAEDRQFGLVVDEVRDNQEIVVKPLDKLLKSLTCYAGATIMGNGHVALILDALGLAQVAGLAGDGADFVSSASKSDGDIEIGSEQALLLFGSAAGDRLAVPLDRVSRLEEFQADRVEYVGGQPVVQYRDSIMPLISLEDALGRAPIADRPSPWQVVVLGDGTDTEVGLIVKQVFDIVQDRVRLQRVQSPGLAGSAIVQGTVTEVVCVDAIMRGVCVMSFENSQLMEAGA